MNCENPILQDILNMPPSVCPEIITQKSPALAGRDGISMPSADSMPSSMLPSADRPRPRDTASALDILRPESLCYVARNQIMHFYLHWSRPGSGWSQNECISLAAWGQSPAWKA